MVSMTTTDSTMDTGARSPGLSYQDLLDADTHPVPDVLRLESSKYFGSDDVPNERYTSRDWHRQEVDQMWSKVWQFACREDHIPEAGDYILYDIAELSFLVMRQEDGTIKARQKISDTKGNFSGILNDGDDLRPSVFVLHVAVVVLGQ